MLDPLDEFHGLIHGDEIFVKVRGHEIAQIRFAMQVRFAFKQTAERSQQCVLLDAHRSTRRVE